MEVKITAFFPAWLLTIIIVIMTILTTATLLIIIIILAGRGWLSFGEMPDDLKQEGGRLNTDVPLRSLSDGVQIVNKGQPPA